VDSAPPLRSAQNDRQATMRLERLTPAHRTEIR
jgi:hypothetical protein